MWTLPKEIRPQSSYLKPTKPATPSLKDKFKIYAGELSRKGSHPTSEDSRRLPVKAYTMKLSARHRGGFGATFTLIDSENRDRHYNITPMGDLLIRSREHSTGRAVLQFPGDDTEEFVSAPMKESLLVNGKGHLIRGSKSSKDVLNDKSPKVKVKKTGSKTPRPTGIIDAADARLYIGGKNEDLSSSRNIGEVGIEYKKSVAECMTKYAASYIEEQDEDSKIETLKITKKTVSEKAKSHRPQTACVRNAPRMTPMLSDSAAFGGESKIMLHSLLVPQKVVLKEKNPMSVGNAMKLSFCDQNETKRDTSMTKEMKMSTDRCKEEKYKQLRDNLKAESFSRIQRYNVSVRGKVTTADNKRPTTTDNKFRISNFTFRGNDDNANGITATYKIEKVIGQGSYAVVRLVTEKDTGMNFALKSYNKVKLNDVARKESVKREIEILESLRHPNIIKLHKTVDTPTQLHLVMDVGGSCSLYSYIKGNSTKRLNEHDAKPIFKQLAEGLAYIHANNIAHRDLKPENILLNCDKNVKIIDFGFAIQTTKGKPLNVFCGTPSYMAPELAQRKNYYGHLVDIWALGIILFWLLTGDFPFKGPTNHELFSNISKGIYKIPEYLSVDAKNLLRKLLRLNPHERPSAKEIVSDKWISGENLGDSNLKDFLSSKIQEYKNLQQPLQEVDC